MSVLTKEQTMKLVAVSIVIFLLSFFQNCFLDQVGNPEPIPIPADPPAVEKIRNTGFVNNEPQEVHLVGLPGAVTKAGEITVENNGVMVKASSTASGSFSVFLTARLNDVLVLRFNNSEKSTNYPLDKAILSYGVAPGPIDGVPPITFLATERVLVRGKTDPNVMVLCINTTTGDVAQGKSDSVGEFQVELAGKSTQNLLVYQDTSPLEDAWELKIP